MPNQGQASTAEIHWILKRGRSTSTRPHTSSARAIIIIIIIIINDSWLHFTDHYHAKTSVLSVTIFTALVGNVFQQWTSLCSKAHVLAGRRPSHTNLLFFQLTSQNSSVMTPGPLYISLARTAQKTSLPAVSLLCYTASCFPCVTILALN
jgi:hypothetical protein